MGERPILFQRDMVRAILEGRKTQTRRLNGLDKINLNPHLHAKACEDGEGIKCPYGKPGDRLWVREITYIAHPDFVEPESDLCNKVDDRGRPRCVGWLASMDADAVRCAQDYGVEPTNPIFVPRWASRLTLEIAHVRVERLQRISEADAKAEGIQGKTILTDEGEKFLYFGHPCVGEPTAKGAFQTAWDEMHNPKGHCPEDNPNGWTANPFVWVIEFKRVEGK